MSVNRRDGDLREQDQTNLVEWYDAFEELVADPHPLHFLQMSGSFHHLLEIPRLSCRIGRSIRIQSKSMSNDFVGIIDRTIVVPPYHATPRHTHPHHTRQSID